MTRFTAELCELIGGFSRRARLRGRARRASRLLGRRPFTSGVEILEARRLFTVDFLVGPDINITKSAANEAETSIAINPTNTNNLFAIDTISYQGRYSTDGGQTWSLSNMAGFTPPPQDAQAVWDSIGNLFVTRMGTGGQIEVGVSSNGGASFSNVQIIAGNAGADQPTLAVGPSGVAGTPGSVWVSYEQDAVIKASGAAVNGLGLVGAFSAPETAPGSTNGDFGSVSIGPAGQVLVNYQDGLSGGAASVEGPGPISTNLDPDGLGPTGFNAAITAHSTNVGGEAAIPPQPGPFNVGGRTIDAEANLAYDATGGLHNGRIYMVYTDRSSVPLPANNNTDIFVIFSDNGGTSWSAPDRVNDDPSSGTTGATQYLPAIALDQTTGNVAVSWYDTRNSGTGTTRDTYASVSVDGGNTWLPNLRLSAAPSNPLAAAVGTFNSGDLDLMSYANGVFYRSWSDNSNSTGDNPAGAGNTFDIYTARVAFEPPTDLNISDASQLEGDSGLTNFVFTVSQNASSRAVTVDFSTSDGSATIDGNDYLALNGTLNFAPGETAQQITIQVAGDKTVESDETFFVTLSNPTNGVIVQGQAVGTILNDDISLSVSNPTVMEGDSGTSNAVFNIAVIGVSHVDSIANYSTSDGSATAGSDYLTVAGTLTISPGATSFNVTVPIVGDLLFESTEDFFLMFTDSTNALISGGVGTCTILDNDVAPSLFISDVQVTNTALGAQAVFTVALVGASPGGITVQYATADGSAKANVDYVPVAGTVSFPLGSIKQLITVPVFGSTVSAPNETFYLNLFNPDHALLADSQGVATIVSAPPPPAQTIIDDGEEGFTESLAGWSAATNLAAYHSDYMVHAPGNGTGTATWTFNNVAPGSYQVFARWVAFSTFASNAPYTVFDGSTSLGTVQVNQQLAPVGDISDGVVWQSLGTFSSSNRTLKVQLSDNANGFVIADAIRIVAGGVAAPAPEMDVSAFGTSIGDGAAAPQLIDGTDFGSLPATTTSATHTFTIANTGSGDLHLSGSPRVTVSGAAAQDFTVVTQPDATIAPGRTSTFQILFHPTAVGLRKASISIADDDASEPNYTFAVAGTGIDPAPNQLIIDDSTAGFSQSGSWASTLSASAMQGEFLSTAAGQGNNSASWTFTALPAGRYHVYTTWVSSGDRASNSPFTVSDGGALAQTFLVNQQQSPGDGAAAGMTWKSLTSIQITTGTLLVSLNNQANGSVTADAVLISRTDLPIPPPAAPPAAHNAAMPLDVNGDHVISGLDALVVINKLIAQSAGSNATASATPLAAAASSQYFLDVNDDTIVSPIDALIVINFLNQPQVSASPSANSLATSAVTSASANAPAALSTVAVDQAISQISAVPQATNGLATSTSSSTLASPAAASATQSSNSATLLSSANVRAAFFASGSKKSLGDSGLDSLLG